MSLRDKLLMLARVLSALFALSCLTVVTVPSARAQASPDAVLSTAPAERAVAVSGNMAPVINAQPQASAAEGTSPALPITVYDADPGDLLTITVRGLPPSLQLLTGTGRSPLSVQLGGRLSFFEAGTYALELIASDGVNPAVLAHTTLAVRDSVPLPLASTPSARYVAIDSLPGPLTLLSDCRWSPTGLTVPVSAPDGIHVYDIATRAISAPVFASPTARVRWSPDGRWLLACVQSPEEYKSGVASLEASPVSGGRPERLVSGADIGKFVWSSSGTIYYWDKHSGERHRVQPPTRWRLANPLSYPQRDDLVLLSDPVRRGYKLVSFKASPAEEESSVPGFTATDINVVAVMAALPSAGQFLVHVFPQGLSPYTAVIDGQGRTLTRFDSDRTAPRFVGTTVSADGRFVVGYHEIDDGMRTLDSQLIVADVLGRWRSPVLLAPRGMSPSMSPTDQHVVFEDPVTGKIHVGILEITAR